MVGDWKSVGQAESDTCWWNPHPVHEGTVDSSGELGTAGCGWVLQRGQLSDLSPPPYP